MLKWSSELFQHCTAAAIRKPWVFYFSVSGGQSPAYWTGPFKNHTTHTEFLNWRSSLGTKFSILLRSCVLHWETMPVIGDFITCFKLHQEVTFSSLIEVEAEKIILEYVFWFRILIFIDQNLLSDSSSHLEQYSGYSSFHNNTTQSWWHHIRLLPKQNIHHL